MSPDHSLLATACAGPESALIMWTPQGDPIALISAPHPSGCAAVDISPDGQFLATLSVPFSAADLPDVAIATDTTQRSSDDAVQEVAVWSLADTRSSLAGESSQPQCLARCIVPTASTQLSIAFRAALAPGELSRIDSGATCSFELCTTGPSAVVFWSLVRSRLLTRPGVDDDPAAEVSGLARASEDGLATSVRPLPPSAGGSPDLQHGPAGSAGAWVEMWSLRGHACHPPGLSPATHATVGALGATGAAVAPQRRCTVTVFLPPVNTGNAAVTCATAMSDGQVCIEGF